MTVTLLVLAAACLALAVGLLVPPDATRSRLARLTRAVPDESGLVGGGGATDLGRARRPLVVFATGAAAVITLVLAGVVAGTPGVVVASALVATAVTVIRLVLGWHREQQSRCREVEVARACAAVAAQVRVGRVPTDALAAAAADHAVLRPAARTRALGGDVVRSLHALARAPGQSGLAELARAWQFSLHTGAPMAPVLDQVAACLRDDQATRRTVAAELAGPRASGTVMAVLPVLGIGLGYLIGGDPVGFLVSGPAGWACLLAGTASALAGVRWMDALARVREPGHDPAPERAG